jgi:polyisoprenoid-binding protein YceI
MQTTTDHAATTPQLGRYEIDASRSAVRFRTRHLFGLAPVKGTFAIAAGTIGVTEPLSGSAIRADIDAASFHTGNWPRDRAVRSARFLDTKRHPVMTFAAERVEGQTITGTLTACGVTRPVTLLIEHSEVEPRSFTVRASTRIDRTDFGVTASRGLAGRYLDLTMEIWCARLPK